LPAAPPEPQRGRSSGTRRLSAAAGGDARDQGANYHQARGPCPPPCHTGAESLGGGYRRAPDVHDGGVKVAEGVGPVGRERCGGERE